MAFNNLKLNEDGTWTKITETDSGTFSLTSSGQHAIYDGTPPNDLIGHRSIREPIDYTVVGSEAVYARSDRMCFAIGDVIDMGQGFDLDKIVMLGASITNQSTDTGMLQMLLPYIESVYGKTITVINEATSGDGVADTKAKIDGILAGYTGESSTVFYLHIGGGDISPSVPYLDTGESIRLQMEADLRYIYDAVHTAGHKLIQAALTFRNYNGTMIDNDPSAKVNELGGSYTYTRDWIVPIMQEKAPEFVVNGWSIIDQYNITRNIYKDWRDPDNLSDVVHPSRYARLIYEQYAIESIVQLSLGMTPQLVTQRNFNDSLLPATTSIDFTAGFGRNTEIGSTDDNINWTIRTRPPAEGTEPIFIDSIKDYLGNTISGVKLYSYINQTERQGGGNTIDPSNNSASLYNNVLLQSGLTVNGGNSTLYMIVTGLEPMRTYTLGFAAAKQISASLAEGYYMSLFDDNTPLILDGSVTNPESEIQYKTIVTDYRGQALIGVTEINTNNNAVISGIQISS